MEVWCHDPELDATTMLRDIWPGDTFEIMWERGYDEEGNPLQDGEIVYANLTLTGTGAVTAHGPFMWEREGGADIGEVERWVVRSEPKRIRQETIPSLAVSRPAG